ncbi:transport and Golgi organization protein 1 homolog isoform X2 [Oryzias melastigma]|uniref:transport and Golgi organization protein 1 homolog isoform X2 n=1 Tax=Oryzias melastigma TaxID=30732 RepID=UPI000CF8162E|nr:transport and Golgi organization protein 1 homolog isoform X2 [Oryzias melastigma]
MAAKHFYRPGFLLLLLFNLMPTSALERRFSDFKRCADEECSMLLCRGKAVTDFSGPDCRFLSFKKSETVYVYYKLSGRRADIWAGSVGSSFGYFPKDLLAVNHLYTEKELEIPTEETDFVCFETGHDKFETYDIDKLLGFPAETQNVENNGTSEQIPEVVVAQKQEEHHSIVEEPQDLITSSPELHTSTESTLRADVDSDSEFVPKEGENFALEPSQDSETKDLSTEEESVPEGEVVDKPASVSETVQIPKLKTTLGTTFDAVTSDDETTTKVTPQVEEDTEDVKDPPEEVVEDEKGTPLLTFSEETAVTPAPETDTTVQKDEPRTTQEKNMWTTLGDAVFSAVTGVETTSEDVDSEEDDDEEEEEAVETPQSSNVLPESQKDPEYEDPVPDVSESKQSNLSGDSNDLLAEKDEEKWAEKPVEEPTHHQEDVFSNTDSEKPNIEPIEDKNKEVLKHSENESSVTEQIPLSVLTENDTVIHQESVDPKIEEDQEYPSDGSEYNDSSEPDRRDDLSVMDVEMNSSYTELSSETSKQKDEAENQVEAETEEEQLLEDENALSFSQVNDGPSDEPESVLPTPEPEYSEDIMRLTLLRDHFTENKLERLHKLLGLPNLFKVEAMFADLDTELQATRLSDGDSAQDIENILENILEASENSILNEIEKMMDTRDKEREEHSPEDFDEEAELLDDFQELAFSLRQKYSTVSDSTALANEKSPDNNQDEPLAHVEERTVHVEETKADGISETNQDPTGAHQEDVLVKVVENEEIQLKTEEKEEIPVKTEEKAEIPVKTEEQEEIPVKVEEKEEIPVKTEEKEVILEEVEDKADIPKEVEEDDIPVKAEEKEVFMEEVTVVSDVNTDEEAEHYNKTKGDLPSFSPTDEMQKASQSTSSEGSIETEEPKAEKQEEEIGSFTTGVVFAGVLVSVIRNKTEEWTTVIISLLPEEWKPGETLFGCPWEAVVVTALVGVLTFIIFFWRTILAVKKREYLLDEQKLKDQIQALKKEKTDALAKISELQKQAKEFKEHQKQTKETASSTKKKMQDLESKVLEMEKRNERIAEERNNYVKLLEEERTTSLQNETRIEKLEKSNEKLQISRKKIQEALTKTTVLLDEVKIREDARSAQHKCVQKEYAALKEENKTLKATIKNWEDKHKELNEKIKVYQKSQKELEDSVVLKDHNVEVLSQLLADLDACDLQKGEISVLANGEMTGDKKTIIKNRIKQLMDVSRVQTTLTVIEEERDRFMAKLLNEEKSRKELEEKHQELEHAIGSLKSDKSHIENQLKILQQKNEIMVEMYQQKENALQQRLTKEELERRSKENMLTEVGDKALEAEEQVKVLRQRIGEMEEQMKKTEQVYKEQIKEQENKTHSNWVNARNAERALSQEKIESSKLREKLAVITSQLNERRAPLFRPNSGQAAGPRQGDSYGPSPVSGGAPSPPIMIEGPRRPPSAPVGRRIDPYGPRPPSDPHGRFSENKPAPVMDMVGPRSSSPANLDSSGPGSFMVSPIRDSPGPMVPGPPPGPGLHDPRFPPPGPYRPPRPGPYQLPPGPFPPNIPPLRGLPPPANGHPGKPLPGPLGGDYGPPPANGHAYLPRTGPGPMMDPRGPPPPHFRPPPLHPFGPMPPPHVLRGSLGPRPPPPADLRFPGPRDAYGPPMDLPPHSGPVGDSYPLQNSAGAQGGPGPGLQVKQEPPQDSRPAAVQP